MLAVVADEEETGAEVGVEVGVGGAGTVVGVGVGGAVVEGGAVTVIVNLAASKFSSSSSVSTS
jgi:hypothetical protein